MIAHNVYLGIVIQALADITGFAERGGVSRAAFLDFLNESIMGSAFARYKSPALVNLDFQATFTIPLLSKDFDLGLEGSHAHSVSTFANRCLGRGAGYLTEDFAVLILEQGRRAGYEITPENVRVFSGLAVTKAD
jgi:3-hydroxyisobutyrate dehydrogenase-like beta-hydroxyacid dehydrogenase